MTFWHFGPTKDKLEKAYKEANKKEIEEYNKRVNEKGTLLNGKKEKR